MFDETQQKLLEDFSSQSDALFSLGIIRTDSFTGEIGEFVACAHFDLTKTDRATRAIDAVDKRGNNYQVKAKKVGNGKISYGLGNLEIEEIDFLVIVYFDALYNPLRIIRIQKDYLPRGKFSISNKYLASIEYEEFFHEDINIARTASMEIEKFGTCYKSLTDHNIIRSQRIVGDIGEYYACQHLHLRLNQNPNEKGVDATDDNGIHHEIKTRRVYESGRRISKSRRLNNLVGKSSETLVVVVLDKIFKCAGMWTMPMENVVNPKSAHLQIVNTTTGVKNIVRSRISWLS